MRRKIRIFIFNLNFVLKEVEKKMYGVEIWRALARLECIIWRL